MKERPILFSGPMVRAILDGSKTQTRRIVKPQPHQSEYEPESFSWIERTKRREVSRGWIKDANGSKVFRERIIPKGSLQSISVHRDYFKDHCPYGKPGDRLWVRETHALNYFDDGATAYRADYRPPATDLVKPPKWRPSIHIPRAASRITLLVKSIRIERLHSISESDAKAEGVNLIPYMLGQDAEAPKPFESVAHWRFRLLWRAINGAESWTANPWVWVVEFERHNV